MRLDRTVPLAGILALLCCLAALAVTADRAGAAEKPFTIEFDSSELQIAAIDGLPLDALSSKASLEGTIDENGKVTIPKGGFKMPEIGIAEPVSIKGFMGIEAPATGTFDEATGQLDLDTEAGIWVSINVKQVLDLASGLGLDLSGQLGSFGQYAGLIGNLTCGFSPMDVHFSTEGTSLATGKRFLAGPTGPGAISAEWSKLGPFQGRTKLLGLIDACALIRDQLPGLLSGLGGDTDLGGFDIGSLLGDIDLSNLDNVDLGPSGITLTRSKNEPIVKPPIDPPVVDPPKKVEPAPAKLRLKVTPKKRKARAGATIRYRTVVKNVGGTVARKVKVCVKAPAKATKKNRRCRVLGAIKPGTAKRGTFRLRLKKSAVRRAYRVGFKVRSGAAVKPSSSASLRIR